MAWFILLAIAGVVWWSLKANGRLPIVKTKQIDTETENVRFGSFVSAFWDDLKDTATKSYRSKSTLHKAYGAIVLMFAIALVSMNYPYFLFMRLAVCIALYFFLVEAYRQRPISRKWFVIVLGLIILYNPITPVHIGIHIVWTVVNVATLLVLYRARMALEGIEANSQP